MDWTVIGTGLTVIGLVYTFLRNFKSDINITLKGMEERLDKMEDRITQLDARMFWLATGKKLEDVLLDERKGK